MKQPASFDRICSGHISKKRKKKMALTAVLVFILTAVALSPVTGQQQDSCAACNCPLETDMDLDGYVNSRISEILGNEPRKLNVIIKISSLQKVTEKLTAEWREKGKLERVNGQ